MTSTVKEPSQAERLGAVADASFAGPGATDSPIAGDPFSEKPVNGSSSNSSEAAAEQNIAEKAVAIPEAPPRSAGTVALIMGSLCVGDPGLIIRTEHDTDWTLDRCLSSCS